MAFLEGKSPSEKKKIIAAGILGVVSLLALYMAFGRNMFGGSSSTATTKSSPTPAVKVAVNVQSPNNQFRAPAPEDNVSNLVIPVVFNPGNIHGAPDAGRNIFAFYEPPEPTPFVPPPPTPPPPPPTPTPPPPLPFTIARVTPSGVYAGSKGGFRLDVYGEGFVPEAKIYFNQTEMPTQYLSSQSLATNIPENLVAREGGRQIIIQTPDGRMYSAPFNMTVMPPPRPSSLQYIGMIGRQRYNNDTAYFMETGRTTPFGARLNDVVAQRFKLVDIAPTEVVVQDVQLGFRHRISMTTPGSGTSTSQPGGGFIPYNPGQAQPGRIPQPQSPRPDVQRRPPNPKDDVDDNDKP